ncbi:aldose 1-epimerase [Pavlovales sp. CCMP2436]|nr:aldose 1-epimerase [Pavlovales sp. CCMP2436]|mmetsp:Transcript_33469/g.77227  ORF Transcript_33469/g.77227 Transcript_33469/m.77227 type:complete len:282 (+) Transcript_33469:96-941(+)
MAAATSDSVVLKHPSGACCEITLFGAHLRSWKLADGSEQMFVSSKSSPAPKALRGGVPICFPQFADRGPGGKHGFARTSALWKVLSTASAPSPTVTLELRSDEATRAEFPGAYRLLYHVTLSADATIALAMQVVNEGEEAVVFTTALHTYFAVSDVTAARIEGLKGTTYEDCAVPKGEEGKPPRMAEESEQLAIVGEVDRVYLATPSQLLLRDGAKTLAINAQGFKDTVVWNIGAEKAGTLNDLGAGEWQRYLCIESALIGRPIKLDAKCSWTAGVSYTVA